MAAVIFPFKLLREGSREYLSFRNAVHEQGAGRRTIQKLHAAGELVVRGRMVFPNAGGSWSDYEAFWESRAGTYEVFLYKRQRRGAAAQVDLLDAATGQTAFVATRRYVDTATLVVRKNGVLQVLGVDYTVQNGSGGAYALQTSPRLVVVFGGAPGLGAVVRLEYEFYFPVRFEGDDLPDDQELHGAGTGGADIADTLVGVQMREAGPGYSYASTPNVL